MEVCGQVFTPSILARLSEAVARVPGLSRSALSRQVCEWLDWRDARGRLKQMSARVALGRLEQQGLIELPAAQGAVPAAQPLEAPVDEPAALSLSLAELGTVELVLIGEGKRDLSGLWRGLFERHHPLGAGPLCGAQLRYLIRSPRYGWLGGLAFSAPALRLGARDRFIGWSEATRRAHLDQVVANTRFLILPQVTVPVSASRRTRRCRG